MDCEAEGTSKPYASRPEPVPLDCYPEVIAEVATNLSNSTELNGTDAVSLWNWLLRFGSASRGLQQEFALWVEWMANYHPPPLGGDLRHPCQPPD